MEIAIILLTYARTEYAIRTIAAIKKNLVFDGDIQWIIADDGSHKNHLNSVLKAVGECQYRSERKGYGANANWAWRLAQSNGVDVTLWLEDDWELRRPFDISPYATLLNEHDSNSIGIVRLGHMPIDLELFSYGYNGHMYLEVGKNQPYAFSGNPHLKHTRFMDYGMYPIGKNPGDTEVAYDAQIRGQYGTSIWWPLLIGDNPPFGHIGEIQSYV